MNEQLFSKILNKYFFLIGIIIFIFVLYIFNQFIFSNIYIDIFEFGGPTPIYSNIYLERAYLSFFEINGIRGYYGYGWPSYFIIFLLSLFYKINMIGIGERIFLLIEIFVSEIFSYKLFKIVYKNKYYAYIFSLAYTFSPAFVVLVFSTSWETYLFYSFEPLIIFLSYKTFYLKNFNLKIYYSISLVSIFLYIYYFDAGIVAWEGVLIFIIFLVSIINKTNLKNKILNLFSALIFIILFISLSNNLSTIILFLTGHSIIAFSGADFGALKIKEILIDLTGNFKGYWPYKYAIFFWFLNILSLLTLIIFKKKIILKPILLSIIIFDLWMLSIWTIFDFNIQPYVFYIAKYLPIFGEYSISSGFIVVSNSIIIIALISGNLQNYKIHINIKNTFIKKNINFISKYSILIIAFIVISTSFIIPIQYGMSNGHYVNFPDEINVNKSSNLINKFGVSKNVMNLDNWFYKNTNINSGYRIYFGPISGITEQEIINTMVFTSTINISMSASNAIGTFKYDQNVTPFAQILSKEGVQYFILEKTNVSSGSASFSCNGWPWQLSYNPIGSWLNWASILNKSKSFTLVSNLSGFLVYKNNLYSGFIYEYKLKSNNFNINNITYLPNNNNNIFIKGKTSNITIWSGVNKTIWNISTKNQTYNALINKSLVTTAINHYYVMNGSSYKKISYLLKGQNMNHTVVDIRFYNSSNDEIGKVASNISNGNPWHGTITNYTRGEFIFKSPVGTKYAIIQLVTNNNINTKVYFKDVSIQNFSCIKPTKITYNITKPYLININNISNNSLIILNANYCNSWNLNGIKSIPYNNGMFTVNVFYNKYNNSNAQLYLNSQKSYNNYLYVEWFIWLSIITYLIVFKIYMRVKKWKIK